MDTPASWGFAGVIVGGLVTGLTTLGVEWLRSKGEWSIDQKKRRTTDVLALRSCSASPLRPITGVSDRGSSEPLPDSVNQHRCSNG